MRILNDISLSKKLLTMAAALSLPPVLLLVQMAHLQTGSITLARSELQGLAYSQGLEELAGPIADHLGLITLYLSGDRTRASEIARVANQADAALAVVGGLEQTIDPELRNGPRWQQLADQWHALKQQAAGLSSAENHRRHTELLSSIERLAEQIADRSKLVLDPEETAYYLMDAAVLRVPRAEMDVFALRSAINVAYPSQLALRAELSAGIRQVRNNAAALQSAVEKLAKLKPLAADAMRRAVAEHAATANAFCNTVESAIVLAGEPRSVGATGFELGTKTYETAASLHDVLVPLLQEQLQSRLSAAQWQRNATMAGYVLLFLLVAVATRLLRRRIARNAELVVASLERMARGEIGRQERVFGSDEFAYMLSAVNRLDRKLVDVVATMRSSADTVSKVANELASGSEQLSERTRHQANSIQETATNMEQMTATVKQNADSAAQANRLVVDARQHAERGGSVVQRAVLAMQEVDASSKRIADIIGVIDVIAFQTNLLALNAAVEAARAGEHGRGFAVVAGEVRSLAQRSAAAAREIKQLIGESTEKTESGVALVNDTGKVLQDILDRVRQVTDVVVEITSASGQQSAGIEQVNTAIATMDAGTQQNAGLVENNTSVSRAIRTAAQRLLEEIAFFRTAAV
jgi:methyl-accepting chemotaxis protein